MAEEYLGCIAALDIGTTTIRCQIFNKKTKCIGSAFNSIKLHYPDPKSVEISPEELWNDVLTVINDAIKDANISVWNVKSLGISTQRATFITWQKDNSKPFHNFITWKDLRASDLIKDINKSWKVWVTIRLLWLLRNNVQIRQALSQNNVMFGTMETWLIYKLTGGKTYVSDISNASATGMYDPFALCWSFIPKYVNIPVEILPEVVDNDYEFGETLPDLFGAPIKIGAVMADQSASMYGSCGVAKNGIKMTLGTGAFLDINTSTSIEGTLNGTYPLVGWRIENKLVYLLEVQCADAGSIVEWMLKIGLITNPGESSDIASGIKNSGGVYFVPAFSGLGPPINNETATTGFIGIKPHTRREHMIRAVLESIAYRITLSYRLVEKDRSRSFRCLRLDGGVSKNDFICQLLANLTDITIERMPSEMATLGVAHAAGITCGIWTCEDFTALKTVPDVFKPSVNADERKLLLVNLETWKKAANRFMSWYS